MENIINRIETLRLAIQALEPIQPEYKEIFDQKIRIEFNYNSNHIEGNTLKYSETELLLIHGQRPDEIPDEVREREYDEMTAHDTAYKQIQAWAKENRPLTETDIKNINRIILVRPFWKEAITPEGEKTMRKIEIGNYKTQPNSVRLSDGKIFAYTSPLDTPIEMQQLMEWYRENESADSIHPVQLAALFHYKFLRIHPFDDGNGRTARLLMNYILLKNNYPPIIIKSDDRNNYLTALRKADAGNESAIAEYIAQKLIWSLELYYRAAQGEDIIDDEDTIKEITLWKNNLKTRDQKVAKTNMVIAQTFNKKGLLDILADYTGKINDHFIELFNDCNVLFSINGHSDYFKLNQIIDVINTSFNAIILGEKTFEVKDTGILLSNALGQDLSRIISDVSVLYILLCFKYSKTELLTIRINIEIKFNDFNYNLNLNFEIIGKTNCQANYTIIKEKSYSQDFIALEKKELVAKMLKLTFEVIRKFEH